MRRTVERTILFADLRGSTGLYERLGNTDATALITHRVNDLARIVGLRRGVLVKTLGDGLMAMFLRPSDAVGSARDMQESMAQVGPVAALNHLAGSLRLQMGIAHGEVIEVDSDVFGDAVNVASRLLDHAGDSETLATASTIGGLPSDEKLVFRSLDRIRLRGRVEPVHVYIFDPKRSLIGGPTTQFEDVSVKDVPEGIRLHWLDVTQVFAATSMPVILGRGVQAQYCIDDTRVSRSHARLDWYAGTFELSDLSYNGTHVRFDNDTEIVSLRRGSCTLHGSGTIGLGTMPNDTFGACVRFEVLKFGDTQASIDLD